MELQLEPAWRMNGAVVDPALFALLAAIHATGSLARAAREVGYSYRHIWGFLGKWERQLGQSLARLERGRGAKLTPYAEKLIDLEGRARVRLAADFAEVARDFSDELSRITAPRSPRLVVHASHDLALAQLRDSLKPDAKPQLELHFHGSLENLRALSRGRCDLAGFHVAEQTGAPELARLLQPGVHRLIGVALREQGLMVARGNPKRIQGLRNLTRRGVRFVNRQPGSGTRLVLDQLLDHAAIDRKRIDGYQAEEFTHLAVAATIAGGMADAGFGIRAAAAQYGLGFIPLVNERYLLACRSDRIDDTTVREIAALLRSRRFKKILDELPGYDGALAGKIMSVGEALAGPRPGGGSGEA